MTDRKERLADRKAGKLDPTAFLKVADAFIDVANRKNKTVLATELSMAFLYAASRYNAHVAKNILEVEKHEDFVQDVVKSFTEMLRQNLADPEL